MENYSVTIAEVSKELSPKERLQIKDTTDTVKLDKATQAEDVIIDVDYYAILNIHNEKSEDKDYKNYIVVDKDGTRYATGSESFWSAFMNIAAELYGSSEDWKLKVFRMASKNREGKAFITCSVI